MRSYFRGLLGAVIGTIVGLWVATLRVKVEWNRNGIGARRRVLAFRHGEQMALLGAERRDTAVLVSHSADGEIQAGVMRRLGFSVVRGSSSRGGASGLRKIMSELSAGRDAAFAVDGPRGPAKIAKPGALLAAKATGAALLPVASAARRVWVLDAAWDKFEVPWPFSRVAVVVGEPLPEALADEERLSAAIARARRRAEILVSSGA